MPQLVLLRATPNHPSTIPWLWKFLLSLTLLHGLVQICLEDPYPISSEQTEPGRQAGGQGSAWRRGYQNQGLRSLSTSQTSSTSYCVHQATLAPFEFRRQVITATSSRTSEVQLFPTALRAKQRPGPIVKELVWSIPHQFVPMAELMEGGLAEEAVHVFSWPVDASLVDGSMMSLALVVMRRQGGFMLALPVEAIPGEELDGASEDSLVGPHTVLTVPGGFREDASGEFRRAGVDLEVLVVDLKEEAQTGLELFDASAHTADLVGGFAEDLTMIPEPSTLLTYTKQWIGVMDAQRVNFYSAEEEEQPPAAKVGAKAKSKAGAAAKGQKQMSAKKVAEAIGSMSELLPSLAAQLVAIQDEQRRMQEAIKQAVQSSLRPGQTPVSSSLQQFMAMTGPPPKTKGLSVKPPPQRVPKAPNKDTVLSMEEQSEQAMQTADPVPCWSSPEPLQLWWPIFSKETL